MRSSCTKDQLLDFEEYIPDNLYAEDVYSRYIYDRFHWRFVHGDDVVIQVSFFMQAFQSPV